MKALAVFFATFSLAGIASADCLTPDFNPVVDPEVLLNALRHRGMVYYTQGRLQDAAGCYLEASVLAGRTEKTEKSAITDLGNLAVLARQMGKFPDAANYLAQQLNLIARLGFEKTTLAAGVYEKRGDLATAQGLFSEAEEHYTQAVALFTECAGGETLESARALSELGQLYVSLGKLSPAANTLHKARAAAEKNLPQDDPRLIPFLDAEASFLASTGRFTEAEKELKRALSIAELVYGEKSIEYAGAIAHLGELYLIVGDFPSAVSTLSRSLEAEGSSGTSDPLGRAVIMSGLADAYARQKNFAEAEPLVRKAAALPDDVCFRVPGACAWVHSRLGDFYMQESEWQAAESQFEQALKLREDSTGESPGVAASLLSLSQTLRRLDRKKEAKAAETRAAQILASHRTPGFNGAGVVDVRTLRASK